MTDRPYTDADLRAEAASCLSALSIRPTPQDIRRSLPDTYIDSHRTPDSGRDATWADVVGEDGLDAPAGEIHALVEGAADVSGWAIQLGADGLRPVTHELTWSAGPQPIVRVHFAFHGGVSDEARDYLVQAVGEALGGVMDTAAQDAQPTG
ncbi:hypothetical protein [Streptomyces cucumeris]|uniref:hypothetical protein n=1 Tax=Streptomyces cucumeris TaxID=2962890 RepID=UPI003D70E98D